MKKSAILVAAALLCSCSQVAQLQSGSNTSSSEGTMVRMRACLMSEANTRYQAGTLFTNSVKATATDMVKTCTKNLALEAAGISAQSQSAAENIITNLKNLATAQ